MIEPFSLHLSSPLSTANGNLTEREGFLFLSRDGVGEATPLPGWTESLDACRDALTTADATDDWEAALDACADAPAARHAVSLARLDAESTGENEPLYRSLGATERVESVPVNATVGDAGVEETVAAVREAVSAGFDCVKLKVGARPVEDDVERVAAVREEAPEVELRADANGAWTREQANRAFAALSDVDLAYVEQPLEPTDLAGHRALREYETGVALDESLAEVSVSDVLDVDAADALILKPMALGGVDRARSAALEARRQGVDAVVTTTIDAVVARTAAVHLAASLPDVPACGLATADMLDSDLAPDPAPVEDGRAAVPQGNGNMPAPPTVE